MSKKFIFNMLSKPFLLCYNSTMGIRSNHSVKLLRKNLGNVPTTSAATIAVAPAMATDRWWEHKPYADWDELFQLRPQKIPSMIFMLECFQDERFQQHAELEKNLTTTLDTSRWTGWFPYSGKLQKQLEKKMNHIMHPASKEEKLLLMGADGLTETEKGRTIRRAFGDYELYLQQEENHEVICTLVKPDDAGSWKQMFQTKLSKTDRVGVMFEPSNLRDVNDQRAVKLCIYALLAEPDLLTELLLAPKLF